MGSKLRKAPAVALVNNGTNAAAARQTQNSSASARTGPAGALLTARITLREDGPCPARKA